MSQAGVINVNGGGGGGSIDTLTGNSGGAVPPTTNNINILGSGSIVVTGNIGTSTLTISDSSALQTTNVIVTSAQLKTLLTVPAQLLAPPGANLSYQIVQVACYVDFATTPYTNTNNADLYIIYGSSVGSNLSCGFFGSGNGVTGTGLLDTSGDAFLGMSNMENDARGMPVADIVNREITLINNAGLNLATGDSDLHLQILYRIVTTPF